MSKLSKLLDKINESTVDIKSKITGAPPHPGMGKEFVTPKDLGIKVVSGSVSAKINSKILKQAEHKKLHSDLIEVGQNYLSRSKLHQMAESPDSLDDEPLTVAHKDGKFHLMDGNHRFAIMKLLNKSHINVRVVPAQKLETY